MSEPSARGARRIARIPGDGVGQAVTDAATAVLDAVAASEPGLELAYDTLPWGSEYYGRTGRMMPADGLEVLRAYDAVLFGAVGWPTVPDHVSLWGLRLAICQGLDQGICVRPVRALPNVASPLRPGAAAHVDFVVVRENTEGEYSGAGGRVHAGFPEETAVDTVFVSRAAVERVGRHAFATAAARPARHLISVTKSNASRHAYLLWDEVMAELAAEHPDVAFESVLVDAMAARLVLAPETVDVVVASNLHADVLSDLTAAMAGGLGVAPSANISCRAGNPSMFEPVHGSAPDLADGARANPLGAILSAALMLDHLGAHPAGDRIRGAVEATCAAGILTPDVGGTATLRDVVGAIVATLERSRATTATEEASLRRTQPDS